MSTDESTDESELRTPTGAGAKRHGHRRAKETDLRRHFQRGEHIEVIIKTPPERNGGEEAVATVNRDPVYDACVFIDPGRCRLHRADQVRCRLVHVEEDFLKALALYRLD